MYLHDTAQVVVESLFVSEDSPGGYTIPPWFWALGDAPLPEEPHDSALGMNDTLAPLAALVKRALEISYGEAVSQSEAARILGVTPAAINRRIERGTLSSRKVGYHVLIPVKEIERARKTPKKSKQKIQPVTVSLSLNEIIPLVIPLVEGSQTTHETCCYSPWSTVYSPP